MSLTITEPALDDISHGLSGYTNNGCKCPVCRRAMADYQADRRQFLRMGHAHLTPGWRDQFRNETREMETTK